MRKNVNSVNVIGRVYSFGEANGKNMLAIKVTGEKSKNPNTTYIGGTINVAVDEAGLNVIPVHFTYVTATTSKGNPNATFTALQNIINGVHGSIMEHGEDKAVKLKVDTAIGLNEFYSDRSGKEELVSAKRNEGGFVHVIQNFDKEESERNIFTCDMVITGDTRRTGTTITFKPDHKIFSTTLYNYDTKNQRAISLDDFFKDGYKDTIAKNYTDKYLLTKISLNSS